MAGSIAAAAVQEWRAAQRRQRQSKQWESHIEIYRWNLRKAVRQAEGQMMLSLQPQPVRVYEFRDHSILVEPQVENGRSQPIAAVRREHRRTARALLDEPLLDEPLLDKPRRTAHPDDQAKPGTSF